MLQVIAAARSEALFFVPNSADDDDTQEAAVAAAAAAAAASSITASQFIDWLLGTAAAARGGSYSGGDTSTDRGSSPESTHGRARASRQGSADREQQQQRQQQEDRRRVRQAMSLIKAAVIEVLEFEASRSRGTLIHFCFKNYFPHDPAHFIQHALKHIAGCASLFVPLTLGTEIPKKHSTPALSSLPRMYPTLS